MFFKMDVLKNFAIFTGKPATLLKKRLWHMCFPVNFVKFSGAAFFIEHLLLLNLFEVSLKPMIISKLIKLPMK